jgi:hypothetical protein
MRPAGGHSKFVQFVGCAGALRLDQYRIGISRLLQELGSLLSTGCSLLAAWFAVYQATGNMTNSYGLAPTPAVYRKKYQCVIT